MSDLLDGYWRLPPISRTIAAAAFVTSVSMQLGLFSGSWVVFWPDKIFAFPPQIWRIFTNFLITGPQLRLIFEPFFLYRYGSSLEANNPRFSRREDFVWYLIFVCSVITALGWYVFGGGAFLSALILAMCRTVTVDQRGMQATIYFLTIPAQLMPFALMVIDLIMGGPYALLMGIIGFVAAHLYDFLTRIYPSFTGGKNLLPTPAFLSRVGAATPSLLRRSYGTAIRPPSQPATGRTTGASMGSGPLPESWKTRGPGRRLGE